MTREQPKLFFIDAFGFIFRAYHALPGFTTSKGLPTGAIFGFCNMVLKLIDEHQPDYLVAVFDSGKPTFRDALYADYKAHRPPPPEELKQQFPYVKRIVEAFNIPAIELDGFEADDLIATLVERFQKELPALSITIVSSDKDLLQLVNERVHLLDTMRDRDIGPNEVEEKYGVRPTQIRDWLALVGDSSDNVPGVPGVGAKTATKLLTEYGDLEAVLRAADEVKGARLSASLKDHADTARLSYRLVSLVTDCSIALDVEAIHRREPNAALLAQLFSELEFQQLAKRFGGSETQRVSTTIDRSRYRTILTLDDLDQVIAEIRRAGSCAVDVETTSLHAVSAELVGISLGWGEGQACYIPLAHLYLDAPKQLDRAVVLQRLEPLLSDASFPKYGQNHKYDWIVLRQAGLTMNGVVEDPMLISYVLDPSRTSHGLDELAASCLGHRMIGYKEVVGKESSFTHVPVGRATEYAAEDAEATFRLAKLLSQRVKQDRDLETLYREVELPLCSLLAKMELYGCLVDKRKLETLSRDVGAQLVALEAEVHREAGWPVNINSPKQLQKLLFEQLGLSTGRKTKTGYSTDSDVLSDLAMEHPIVEKIESYRTLHKLKSGYLDALPSLVNPKTKRIHTSYNQAVAATGRLSSSDPNLQNIPIRTDLGRQIREAFVADTGRLLLSADYSQIELRILAHLSHDAVLVDAFRKGQDVHSRTAMEVFGIDDASLTPEHRRVAKAVNFGVIYGQTDFGLSRQLRIPQTQAKAYIEGYFARYAGVKTFMDETIAEARRTKVVKTLLGRKRLLADIDSDRRPARLYAERIARNTPIQGTAADLIKLAMIHVDRALREHQLDAPMILTVHDELVFEVFPDEVERVSNIVEHAMSHVFELSVPLKVDIGVGASWADAH